VNSSASLTEENARQLMATSDLVTVGMIATEARRAKLGDQVSYVRVAEITAEAAAATPAGLGESFPAAAREIRITGTPASLSLAAASARAVSLALGGSGVTLTAFSLTDLLALADGDVARLREVAQALRDAGVVAIAEVAVDQLPAAAAAAEAIEAVTGAGLLAPVATWQDAPEDPVAALFALRALQERTRAFRAFAPLPRRGGSVTTPSTGYEDVKIVAVARAVLTNIDHIQVDWSAHGPKLAQVALLFGASDLDRVSPTDDSPLGHRRAPLEEVQRNIKAAFLQPVERDGRFERVVR
jgi:aminodeoxyfutalosine synthase